MSDNQNSRDGQIKEKVQQYHLSQDQFKIGSVVFDMRLSEMDVLRYQKRTGKRLIQAQQIGLQESSKNHAVNNLIDQLNQFYTDDEEFGLSIIKPQHMRFVKKILGKREDKSNMDLKKIYEFYQGEQQWQGSKEIKEKKKLVKSYWPQFKIWQYQQIYKNTILTNFSNLLFKIQFQNLTNLDISKNNITSIEGLCYAQIPNLQMLQIFGNRIANFNCLHKCRFKKLQTLTFYNNPILEINRFPYGEFQNLKEIQIDGWLNYNNNFNNSQFQTALPKSKNSSKTIIQSINFMYKLKSIQKLKRLQIQDQDRILNKRQTLILLKKIGDNLSLKINEKLKKKASIEQLSNKQNQNTRYTQFLNEMRDRWQEDNVQNGNNQKQ